VRTTLADIVAKFRKVVWQQIYLLTHTHTQRTYRVRRRLFGSLCECVVGGSCAIYSSMQRLCAITHTAGPPSSAVRRRAARCSPSPAKLPPLGRSSPRLVAVNTQLRPAGKRPTTYRQKPGNNFNVRSVITRAPEAA